jgi:diadenosine tetraphosphate (Ap4A) HIT family hydrolase
MAPDGACPLCQGPAADAGLRRVRVWEDGPEARTFGPVLARCRALRAATGAERVDVAVFGSGIPHLHVQLVAHRPGDALTPHLVPAAIPDLPETEFRQAADRLRQHLS